jgi:hypothetical protein
MVDDIVAGALTLLVWSVGVRALAYF